MKLFRCITVLMFVTGGTAHGALIDSLKTAGKPTSAKVHKKSGSVGLSANFPFPGALTSSNGKNNEGWLGASFKSEK